MVKLAKFKKNPGRKCIVQQESENYSGQDNIGVATLTGLASPCSLFNSVILDSGTNVHNINDAIHHRMIDSRAASSRGKFYSGNRILQSVAKLKVEVHVKLDERSKVLTLSDALYVPTFMSNSVTLERLSKVNIHYDSLSPLQLYQFT